MHKQPSKKILNLLLILILAGCFFSLGFYVGDKKNDNQDSQNSWQDFITIGSDKSLDLNLFWTVYDFVSDKYIKKDLNKNDLVYGAINGLVSSLEDEHSYFMNPEETAEFANNLDNIYEGIGAYISIKENIVTIDEPLADSPAQKAGIKAGDKILKIDDKSTEGMNIDEAASLLKGEKGTKVKLTIYRTGETDLLEIEVTRDEIDIPIVKWEKKENNIVYIRLNKFEKETYTDLKEIAEEIAEDSENKKIILDLRNNRGGYFEASIDTVGLFVDKNKVAVIEKERDDEEKEFRTDVDPVLKDYPIVVLINSNTASASEIVAGALRDLKKTQLIGETSYGKGSVQEFKQFEDGSSIKITIATWLTPGKEEIDGKGLTPDIEIELTEENIENDQDPQLDKAIEILNDL